MTINEEIRIARMEKQIETLEAENESLRNKINRLELEICSSYPPLREPVEVVGSWHTTKGASV